MGVPRSRRKKYSWAGLEEGTHRSLVETLNKTTTWRHIDHTKVPVLRVEGQNVLTPRFHLTPYPVSAKLYNVEEYNKVY